MNRNCHKWKTWFLSQNDLYSFYGSFLYKKVAIYEVLDFSKISLLLKYGNYDNNKDQFA